MRVAIIGAGASGMMAAATLVEFGVPAKRVSIFDGNSKMGKKVAITGGGRCNLTTGLKAKKELLSKYVRGAEFLERSLGAFSPKKTMEWFVARGCELKIQEDSRVFPVSDDSSDVIAVFERALSGCDLRFGTKIEKVVATGGAFEVRFEGGSERFDAIVVATGGSAYSKTGSDGFGHAMARSFGHSVTPLAPSLSAYVCSDAWCAGISGLALKNARLMHAKSASVAEGAMMFAHFGITGPAVFALSARMAFETVSESVPANVLLVPDASKRFEDWEAGLSSAFSKEGAKELKNVLQIFFPRRLAEILPGLARLEPDRKCSSVSREERKALSKMLSDGIPLTVVGTRPGEEFVTAGGVELSEIDNETMESKIVANAYFVGEVLNVDAVTGGFNLQACWSVGRSAGRAIAAKISHSVEV